MKKAAEELGVAIEWGGDWKTFRDGPHFQLSREMYPSIAASLPFEIAMSQADAELILSAGDTGEEVRVLQILLNDAGYTPLAVDGEFGPKTHWRVALFQDSQGLVPDGVVDPITRKALLNFTKELSQ
ncbi:MAG: peptidoglycan-binding protein [Cohaesibacteraceae bacterium]|nr:peptidoglycan-binding protein [Cohaesibacteraceae bacterium]MBL4877048.1 peptidoglycan-binding protein [Cohaesibacteraceae bacterium]